MHSSLQYFTFLHLHTVRRMFLLLHHSQIPMVSTWFFSNLKAKDCEGDGLNSMTRFDFWFRVSWLSRKAEFMRGSRVCPGNSIPLFTSIFALVSDAGSAVLKPSATAWHLLPRLPSESLSCSVYNQILTSRSVISYPAAFNVSVILFFKSLIWDYLLICVHHYFRVSLSTYPFLKSSELNSLTATARSLLSTDV
jgi:hypothetical protein